jgi:hypothetical protein
MGKRLNSTVDAILVPQGAEYQAVCRGLNRVNSPKPEVLPIPVGAQSVTQYLKQWQQTEYFSNQPKRTILLMGLCGSLSSDYRIGDIVLYQECVCTTKASEQWLQPCDGNFSTEIYRQLQEKASLVRAITSDRVISSAAEKRELGQRYAAGVVDMEGFAVLKTFNQVGAAVAMLRVVSDDCHHDIPDLSAALSADGSMRPLPMAIAFGRQPIAATRLIIGALRGLRVLEDVTTRLFQSGKINAEG